MTDPLPDDDRSYLYWVFQPHRLFLLAILAALLVFVPRLIPELPDISRQPEYRIPFRQVLLKPAPPNWVPANFLEQVQKSARLPDDLPLLNERLAEELHAAFARHAWVERVVSVVKTYPASVEVTLEYRRPAALIHVADGLYPVDAKGVLLPSTDFAPSSAQQFPLVKNIVSVPNGGIGRPWGDPVVTEAAALADAFRDKWSHFKLQAILAPKRTKAEVAANELSFELLTRGNSRILWGRGPGSSYPGELSTPQKLGRLEKYLQEYGSFDQAHGPYEIDIRHWQEISRRPLLQDAPTMATKPSKAKSRH